MIEATCGACGTIARMAEADVPVGAKFVTCASCKSRVPLPQASAPAGKAPGKGVAGPPAIPRTPPPIPSGKPTVDLADLPAPKRSSALAGVEPSKPAPRSGLADAELPTPKTSAKAPTAPPSSIDLDDLMSPSEVPRPVGSMGLADLPAPKQRASALGDAPASKPTPSALADLPSPKAKPSALADLPAPKAKPSALADLPAPKAKPTGLDLDLPAPKARPAGLDLDLPPPRNGALELGDLPAPKPGGGPRAPAPNRVGGGALDFGDDPDLDLPAPRGGGALELGDLPGPTGSEMSGFGDDLDLPMPKPGANSDLPAPKGFFDDLPQPAKKSGGGNIDLPAPKGFFDDLPQPVASSKHTDLPAPKSGFFDDLPQPVASSKHSDLPAPKSGFFDDLPQPAKSGPKQAPAAKGGAPKPDAAGGAKPASVGLFDDLEQPAGGGPDDIALGSGDMDLSAPSGSFDLGRNTGGGAELDLGLPLTGDSQFTDLDLSEPSAPQSAKMLGGSAMPDEPPSPIKIKTPAKGASSTPIPITVKKEQGGGGGELKLDLADDPHAKQGGGPAAAASAKATAAAAAKPKKAQLSPEEIAEAAVKKKKRTRIALGAVLGVVLAGGGGFYYYQKHTAEQARQDEIASGLATARRHLSDGDPQHWQRASAAAQHVLEIAPSQRAALGLAAEAALAGALDNGINFQSRVSQGRKLAQEGLGQGSTPELERAQALMTITANQADRAIPLLDKIGRANPKDGWLQLYMGWAQLAKGDADAAIKALENAIATTPATKIPATYSIGRAKLMKADIEGAKTSFAAVLEAAKDHIGAQVGLAATLPPQQSAQREADLRAILNRPDIKTADPRAVVQAWDLLGDIARNTGRLDIAREAYRKAIAIEKLDIPAHVGLASVELRDGKTQVASDLIEKAVAADGNNADAQLVAAELDVVLGKLPDAQAKLEKLETREPPLPPLLRARVHVVKGKWLEAQGKDTEAIAEYVAGAKLAGELDLTPTMAAVTKLAELAKKEVDPAKAAAMRQQAHELLSALADRAKEDGELSLTLGIAYLQAGDAIKAEDSLRRAVTLREKDPEAKLQLARSLSALGRIDDAIAQLKEALVIDGKRIDIALELARTYQRESRDSEAMATYEKLLADPAVDVVVRGNAGKYFAARGARDKAALQAEPILTAEPENPAGLYLKGEGLMLAGKWDEARIILTKATDIDQSDAQYLDALGRAFEGSYWKSADTKYIEAARHAYDRATKADPKAFHAHLGLGRMLVAARKWDEAITPLKVASALNPKQSEVMYNMGLAFFGVRHQGPLHKKNAADWLEAGLKNQPTLTLGERADASWRLGQLYVELNKGGDAARTMENATLLGEQLQKETGKTPDWLVETYFDLGDMYYRLNNFAGQRRAWQRYVDSKPKPGVRLDTANRGLATHLKNY